MTTKIALAHGQNHKPELSFWKVWLVRYKRWLFTFAVVLLACVAISVMWQFVYSSERALPHMSIGGIQVGGKDRAAIITTLQDYAQQGEVTVISPSKQWQAKWQSIGVAIDAEASADAVLSYSAWERAIPFSSIIRAQQSRSAPLVAAIDNDRLDDFAQKIVKEDRQAASDATITVQDGIVKIDAAKNGYLFKEDSVKYQVQAAMVSADATLQLVPERIQNVRPESALAEVKAQAEAVLGRELVLHVGDKQFTPGVVKVGEWLEFTEDPSTKELQLGFNREAINQYLGGIDEQVAIAPGASTVTLLDGHEIARTPAPSGRSVAVEDSVESIIASLMGSADTNVQLAVQEVPPRLTYVRTYSSTNQGLLAIIADWNAAYYGDFAVVVRELGGQNRYAELQADKPYVTASTFKLFTYYAVQQRIAAGDISYGTLTDIGWTVEACLQEIIVRSTNPCATSLMNLIGWAETQHSVASAGFSATNVNNQHGGDKYSTVRDESNYLLRLHHGTLMNTEATQRLLGYMQRQIWRAGIPAGVPGVAVANKVGLYNGWVHDVAIVYGPNSTYILAIMSKSGSDPAFANLSKRIYDFFKN